MTWPREMLATLKHLLRDLYRDDLPQVPSRVEMQMLADLVEHDLANQIRHDAEHPEDWLPTPEVPTARRREFSIVRGRER